MVYTIEDTFVYQEYANSNGSSIKQMVGGTNKTETMRIDSNTVTDISYQFDVDLGVYTELSRANRTDVQEIIVNLEDRITALEDARLADMLGI